METAMPTGLEAVKATIKIVELARRLGITRGAIQQWKKIPAERLGEISSITGLAPNILRPDLFPLSEAVAVGEAE